MISDQLLISWLQSVYLGSIGFDFDAIDLVCGRSAPRCCNISLDSILLLIRLAKPHQALLLLLLRMHFRQPN